jgi:hypothetical protein
MTTVITEADFLHDVRDHRIQVIRDDGEYRHIRFSRPDTYCMQFDLITWPGYLAYSGDMCCYVFSRIRDMFEFFRGSTDGPLRVNLGYWHEKVQAQDRHGGTKAHSPERFRECVLEDSADAPEAVKQAIELEVLRHADEEHEAWRAISDFEHDGWHFQDFWDHDCTEYVHRYVWCCFALVWGIRQYDAAKATAT